MVVNQRWGSDAQDEREEEVPVVLGAMGDGHIVRYLKGRDERLQPGMCGVYSKPGKAQVMRHSRTGTWKGRVGVLRHLPCQ